MSQVLIVKGSARKESTGTKVVEWIKKTLNAYQTSAEVDVVDLATFHLPYDAEPYMAATGKYVSEQTKLWSKKVSQADVVVFAVPEYNGSYPAALKNAIDHLKNEWKNKKVVVVAYSPSGASSVTEILSILLKRLEMDVLGTVQVPTYTLGFDGETGVSHEFEKVAETEAEHALVDIVKKF
ncbi:NADPH-dependent FMN reductase [Basilea psittacipulmonis]|uniref:NADPH-dependent FMN reductase n=1 Tax=Basilea psittacipulmonis TaxID=1472345 RepID=UPI00068D2B5C|nr:NAD(P)H-dependent oxidoreductase [Basilea psittacipulmonis]